MESLKEDQILKFRPDTLENVRKDINLDTPDRIKEAIDILENWTKMQPHFTKKEFDRAYLERVLVVAKGSVERAKEKLDKLCTFKTLMPDLFTIKDAEKNLMVVEEIIYPVYLPTLTPENHRIGICKWNSADKINSTTLSIAYKYFIMLTDYLKRVDYAKGCIVIIDYRDVNVMSLITKFNPMDTRRVITLLTEGYGLRIKAIHLIVASKMVESLMMLLKQMFSAKLAKRIHTHNTIDTVYEYVPKDILNVDYGGKEKPLSEIHKDWLKLITSQDVLDTFKEMADAKSNESYRPADQFNENYSGMPGSFRSLTVD